MKQLLLVACLAAVCSAAPPVPNIAQAFCGSGDSNFGKCKRNINVRERYSAACVSDSLE